MSIKINNKKIIVVLPAYNAERTVKQTVDAIPKEWIDDIILVDDKSRDNTVAVSRALGLKTFAHPKNRGYGGNQKTCYREARKLGADIVVMVHPDFQYDPVFIPEMLGAIARGECDAVFGSRMMVKKNALLGGMPYWKFIANIFLTKIENFVLGMNLTEYHSGFRAYSARVLELPLELNSDDFVFDTEIIAQMRVAGMKIKEIPILTKYFPGASMIGFLRSVVYGFSILGVMGRYLLFRAGLVNYRQFAAFSSTPRACPLCGSARSELKFRGTKTLEQIFHEPYLVTEGESRGHADIYTCLNCGLCFVQREGAEEASRAAFYENAPLDENYLADAIGRKMTARRVLKRLIHYVAGGKLLDIGCNAGLFLAEAKNYFSVSGIEVGRAAAEYARKNLGLNVSQDPDALNKIPDASLDAVTAFDVVEHVAQPRGLMEAVYAKLKPGGVFVFTVPNIGSFFARVMGGRWHALLPSHLSYFTLPTLGYFLRTSKFELVYARTYWRFLSAAYLLRRLLRRKDLALPTYLNITVPVNLGDEMEVYLRKPGM